MLPPSCTGRLKWHIAEQNSPPDIADITLNVLSNKVYCT